MFQLFLIKNKDWLKFLYFYCLFIFIYENGPLHNIALQQRINRMKYIFIYSNLFRYCNENLLLASVVKV